MTSKEILNDDPSHTDCGDEEDSSPALPTQLELANLAAQLQARHNSDPQIAVEHALMIWLESGKLIAAYPAMIQKEEDNKPFLGIDPVPLPKEFPAPFEEFIRLVLKGKKSDDKVKRFRDFLSQIEDPFNPNETPLIRGKEAGETIGRLKNTGFKDERDWRFYGEKYRQWWKEQVSNTRTVVQKIGQQKKSSKPS